MLDGEMLIIIRILTLIQIFCELILYFRVIFKRMRVADDAFPRNPEWERVKKREESRLVDNSNHSSINTECK